MSIRASRVRRRKDSLPGWLVVIIAIAAALIGGPLARALRRGPGWR